MAEPLQAANLVTLIYASEIVQAADAIDALYYHRVVRRHYETEAREKAGVYPEKNRWA